MDRDDLTDVVMPSVQHRAIHGTQLAIVRSALTDSAGRAVSQAKFAAVCGHSQQFQQRIEAPGIHEVPVEMAEKILSAIRYFRQ